MLCRFVFFNRHLVGVFFCIFLVDFLHFERSRWCRIILGKRQGTNASQYDSCDQRFHFHFSVPKVNWG